MVLDIFIETILSLFIEVIYKKIILPFFRNIGAFFRFVFIKKEKSYVQVIQKPHNGKLGLLIVILFIITLVLITKNY